MKNLISIDDVNEEEIETIFSVAKQVRDRPDLFRTLSGRTLACLFYEPSTRTSSSFIAAMSKLGGSVIPITQGVQFSSISKGETLEDTIVTLGQYADVIVLRSSQEGDALRAAQVSPVPIINAGDGIGEHPTQALLDLFTIQEETHNREGIEISLVGDLKNGRTIHSLVKLFSKRDVRLNLVSPAKLRLPDYLLDLIPEADSTDELEDVLGSSDVIYMTRVQKERFTDEVEYESVKNSCCLTLGMMGRVKRNAILMHPLPRVNEIDRRIDADPRAKWFQQVKNGLWVRSALLYCILCGYL